MAADIFVSSKLSFSKADRILKRPEFIQLSRNGKKIQNRHFILIYLPGHQYQSRLGITVSKRVGNAVKRNRIKRLTREFFRHNRHRQKGTWDINIIAKKQAANLSSAQIFLSFENLFKHISGNFES
jgi:ribonuclease P protein component